MEISIGDYDFDWGMGFRFEEFKIGLGLGIMIGDLKEDWGVKLDIKIGDLNWTSELRIGC